MLKNKWGESIMALYIIQGTLAVFTIFFITVFVKDYLEVKKEGKLEQGNFIIMGIVGFMVNFFDALGVGSFAPSTAIFKISHMVEDRIIPGTLNVATCIPVIAEAFIFMTVVKVDTVTLVAMIVSSVIGAYCGASFFSKLPEKKIQFAMGSALLIVAVIMLVKILHLMPAGGQAIGLTGIGLVIGCAGAFILGITNCLGIGSYAPMMALIFTLGVSPLVAFPIMMGSTAFLQPVASAKFVKEGAYNRKVSLAFSIFGAIGVLIAAYIVKSIPVATLTKLVFVVVIYTSITMFRSAMKKTRVTDAADSVKE